MQMNGSNQNPDVAKKKRNSNRRKSKEKTGQEKEGKVAPFKSVPSSPTPGPSSSVSIIVENVQNLSLYECERPSSKPHKKLINKLNKKTKTTVSPQCNLKPPKKEQHDTFPPRLAVEDIKLASAYGFVGEGIIRINQRLPAEAYITHPFTDNDILIEGVKDRNRALDGDEVYFAIKIQQKAKKEDHPRLLGTVLAIKTEICNRTCVGAFDKAYNKKNQYAVFVPTDPRYPLLHIPRSDVPPKYWEDPEAFTKFLFYAKLESWEKVKYAEGRLLALIGQCGTFQGETNAIILTHELIVEPYPEEFNRYFPSLPYKIPEEELRKRTDLRKKCIFTIDPETAKDLDDALSVDILPEGYVEVGIHISDVSFFLKEDNELNTAVAERATSVYLVHEVYHMLPRDLCSLCSLTPGEDKLTFSVFLTFSLEGILLSKRFERSVINSCIQLSYEQAQAILEERQVNLPPILNNQEKEDIISSIWILNKLAVKLRKARFDRGALRIDKVQIHFDIDYNDYQPISYSQHLSLPAHQLIEEFMLLANISVAEKIVSKFPEQAFLRCHPAPLAQPLKRLQTHLEKYGIVLDISSSKGLQNSLNDLGGLDERAKLLVVSYTLTKPMTRALYFCGATRKTDEEKSHYALSVPLYTHFTSPIRRYADVMVHRLLGAALGLTSAPSWTTEFVQGIASNCNRRKYNAKMAEDSSRELFFRLYLAKYGPQKYESVVCGVFQKSFECIILETGIHCKVHYDKINGTVRKVEDENGLYLKVRLNGSQEERIIDIFSIVTLVISCDDSNKLVAAL